MTLVTSSTPAPALPAATPAAAAEPQVLDVPFGRARGPELRREPRFTALEDEIDDLLRARRA